MAVRILAVLVVAVALLAGCSVLSPAGELRTETQSVEAGGAASASVLLQMDAGTMAVTGGADELMEASFTYNVADWQPEIRYDVNGSQGELVVTQPEGDNKIPLGTGQRNEWTVRLNDDMPLALDIQTGAGVGTLDLSTLDLSALNVDVGAGKIDLDLSGSWDHDVAATISGGVGELSVTLPGDMSVRVDAGTGLGNVTTSGLTQSGSGYVNEAYNSAGPTLTVAIDAGVGAIELKVP